MAGHFYDIFVILQQFLQPVLEILRARIEAGFAKIVLIDMLVLNLE